MADLYFSVDSALLNELGDKIVEHVHIALVELVKNAYDADATEVIVQFVPQDGAGPEIRVSDNGSGMTFSDIENFWMRIATTNKLDNPVSKTYGRPKTGAKGIGRFCCRRLGTELKLVTTGRLSSKLLEQTEVDFPWLDFIAGTDVTKVKCKGDRKTLPQGTTGTTLIVSGRPTNEWKQIGFDYLKRQLAVLVANRGCQRDGYEYDPGFNVILDAEGFKGGLGDLREKLIAAGWGTLTGKVNKAGRATYTLEALGMPHREISNETIFEHLNGVEFKLGILLAETDSFRDKTVLSKGTLSKILDDWGGVQVRYNAFRVYPYGNDDWLDIEKDRAVRKGPVHGQLEAFSKKLRGIDPTRVLLSLLSMRSYVGQVEIGPDAKGFEMKASREGFVESDALKELRKFVRFGVDWSTIHRDHQIRSKVKDAADVARIELAETLKADVDRKTVVDKALTYIQKEARNLSTFLPARERRTLEKNLVSATTAILSNERANQEELLHLRLVASTSTLLLIFAHEVKALLGMLQSTGTSLEILEKKSTASVAKNLAEIRREMLDSKLRFSELLEMTSLIGVDSRKKSPQRLVIADRAARAARCFKLIAGGYQIAIDLSGIPQNLSAGPLLEAELLAIFLNAISNSIKSVIAAGRDKKISISASSSSGNVVVSIRDTGLGLAAEYYEEVFIPFISDPEGKLYPGLKKRLNPEDNPIIGSGSGLGLSIIREIANARGGAVRFVRPHAPWKAELEVTLPSK